MLVVDQFHRFLLQRQALFKNLSKLIGRYNLGDNQYRSPQLQLRVPNVNTRLLARNNIFHAKIFCFPLYNFHSLSVNLSKLDFESIM